MGINMTKELKLEADSYGNHKWILPHGMVL